MSFIYFVSLKLTKTLNVSEFIKCSYKKSASKKFQIYPLFTLFPWNFSKPSKNICYYLIYKVIIINKSAYK